VLCECGGGGGGGGRGGCAVRVESILSGQEKGGAVEGGEKEGRWCAKCVAILKIDGWRDERKSKQTENRGRRQGCDFDVWARGFGGCVCAGWVRAWEHVEDKTKERERKQKKEQERTMKHIDRSYFFHAYAHKYIALVPFNTLYTQSCPPHASTHTHAPPPHTHTHTHYACIHHQPPASMPHPQPQAPPPPPPLPPPPPPPHHHHHQRGGSDQRGRDKQGSGREKGGSVHRRSSVGRGGGWRPVLCLGWVGLGWCW
jgi:hypothetical protein